MTDTNSLLNNIIRELDINQYALEYVCITHYDLTNEAKNDILDFINRNYKSNERRFNLRYSSFLLDYFLSRNTLSIAFFLKNTIDDESNIDFKKMIGFISGTKRSFNILKNTFNGVEVDFLSLHYEFRHLHVSSYMINILTKECIRVFKGEVNCAFYTIGKVIKRDHFSFVCYQHRPLNIERLLYQNMIQDSFHDPVYKKIYNTFSYPAHFLTSRKLQYYNGQPISLEIAQEISEKINIYNEQKHDVYDVKTVTDIMDMFDNKAFHHFIICDNDDNIVDYMCMYLLETVIDNTKVCRNGYVYCMFINTKCAQSYANSLQQIYPDSLLSIFEYVCDFCKKQDIFDIVTTTAMFEDGAKSKLLPGTGQLYYYMYNIQLPYIKSERNGLVTI